jgi:hypothetical protein
MKSDHLAAPTVPRLDNRVSTSPGWHETLDTRVFRTWLNTQRIVEDEWNFSTGTGVHSMCPIFYFAREEDALAFRLKFNI